MLVIVDDEDERLFRRGIACFLYLRVRSFDPVVVTFDLVLATHYSITECIHRGHLAEDCLK